VHVTVTLNKLRQHPILILFVINLIIGLMTFRSYGLSWDEPLFYDYGEALKYAYTPANWFSGDFNVTKSFGSSSTDHANRGPAYLLLPCLLLQLWKWLGFDLASAWHLTNFLTFTLGIYLLYRLASRWMSQLVCPCGGGYSPFNLCCGDMPSSTPKDIPFLTFFLGSVTFRL
jgi:hypothetical protein